MLPPSAEALRVVLLRGGEVADAIRKRFQRPIRWRWLNGSGRRPDLATAQTIHEMTNGEVAMTGWYTPEELAAYREGRAA